MPSLLAWCVQFEYAIPVPTGMALSRIANLPHSQRMCICGRRNAQVSLGSTNSPTARAASMADRLYLHAKMVE